MAVHKKGITGLKKVIKGGIPLKSHVFWVTIITIVTTLWKVIYDFIFDDSHRG